MTTATGTPNEAFVVIRDLLVRRAGRTVLEVQSLTVNRGEVLAILGPNGAGKSTLLLTLARLLKPERGEIWFGGKPLSAESDLAYRRRIALVLQDPLLFDTSVYENVAIGLRFRGWSNVEIHPKVEAWLERLRISHLSKRRASELSGGEGQRVSLARALVLEPELLLLDEPFAALDPPARARLLDDLGNILPESHTTTIFITHDAEEACKLAGRMAVVLDGRLAACGTPQEILQAFPMLNGHKD
ncbi:MAG TPA: ATP-binding cassette domain-containing protein [Anaerolineales bacterium]|nr:ATP-binding cassette domain-containing protein [Anaerolineales bacterium]